MKYRTLLACSLVIILSACGGGGGGSSNNDNNGNSNNNDDTPANNNSPTQTPTDNNQGSPTNTSHNPGQNCIDCHQAGGEGEAAGIFSVAGTIFNPSGGGQSNATVTLYVNDTNTQIVQMQTDANGNFYSAMEITQLTTGIGNKPRFVDGVEAVVEGSNGQMSTMPGLITGGSCNGCHTNGSNGNGRIVAN